MRLNRKRINLITDVILVLLLVAFFVTEKVFDIKLNFGLLQLVILTLILKVFITRPLMAKYDPEALRKEEEIEAKDDTELQWVKTPLNLGWGLCDITSVVILVISLTMTFNKNLPATSGIMADTARSVLACSLFSAIYLVISYLPKPFGGTIGFQGKKQFNQLICRSHVMALLAALTALCIVHMHLSRVFEWLAIILFVAFIILFFSKYFIKRGMKRDFFGHLVLDDTEKNIKI